MSFFREGQMLKLAPHSASLIHTLAPGYYRVGFDPKNGFYLIAADEMSVPAKLYGDVEARAERVFTTYLSRECSTGVLLLGEKGGGKTMLARKLCMRAVAEGQPVIICDQGSNISDPGFAHLLQAFDFPFTALFDEFEKCFDRVTEQSTLLSLMDGLSSRKRLMILTSNEKRSISPFMLDRPGRIFYTFTYDGIDTDVIREYCLDKAIDDSQIKQIILHAAIYGNMSFDILQAIVEEMQRYEMPFSQAVQGLNINVNGNTATWKVGLLFKGRVFKTSESLHYTPGQADEIYIGLRHMEKDSRITKKTEPYVHTTFKENGDGDGDVKFHFNDETLKGFEVNSGHLVFGTPHDFDVVLQREVKTPQAAPIALL